MTVKPPDASAAPDGTAFAEAHRQLLADPSIQFELPRLDLQPPPEPPAWLRWLAEQFSKMGNFEAPGWLRSLFNFFEGVAPGLGTAFYVLLGIIVLVAVYFIVRFVLARIGPRAAPEIEAGDWRPEAGPALQLLGEADALAARGAYSEAAHLLLFRSIEDIDSRRPDLVRPALTSRDIAGLERNPVAAALRLRADRDAGRAQPVRAAAARRAATGATAARPMRNSPSPTGGADERLDAAVQRPAGRRADRARPRRLRRHAAAPRLRRPAELDPRRARARAFGRRDRLQGAGRPWSGRSGATEMIDGAADLATEDLVVVALEPKPPAGGGRTAARAPARARDPADPAEMGDHARSVAARLGAGARRRLRARRRRGRSARISGSSTLETGPPAWPAGTDILDGLAAAGARARRRRSRATNIDAAGQPAGRRRAWSRGSATSRITSLADPDLFNNHGLRDPAAARAALALIDRAQRDRRDRIAFDLTLNGLAARRLAQPAAHRARAALPADDPGAARRRLARRPARRLPLRPGRGARSARSRFGKAALVENSAGLIRLARREARLGGAYADVVRQDVGARRPALRRLQGEALDAYLDRLSQADGAAVQRARRPSSSGPATGTSWSPRRARSFPWKKDIIR